MRAAIGALIFAALMGASESGLAQERLRPDGRSAARMAISNHEAAQFRRRPRVRIYSAGPPDVVPRYNPGPNAVRECNATYVQEFRPSGTVIVPRMSCYWRQP